MTGLRAPSACSGRARNALALLSERQFTSHADIFDIFVIGSPHLSQGAACLFPLLTS